MTVLDVPLVAQPHQLPSSIRCVRRLLPLGACAWPAAALRDPAVATWVRGHGLAVTACGDDELDAALALGVKAAQVVLRCSVGTESIRRAANLGVAHFVVSTDRHVDVLAGGAGSVKHVYLDDRGPVVLGERRLDVIGMHCDVDDSQGPVEWGAAAERLLCRVSLMRTCGLQLTRISLAGGSAEMWLSGRSHELSAIASAIDEALDDGCARWRLPRPAVVLSPLTAV